MSETTVSTAASAGGFLNDLNLTDPSITVPSAVAPGVYPAIVSRAQVQPTKKNPNILELVLIYKIEGTKENGRTVREAHSLENTDIKKKYLKGRLVDLKVPMEKWAALSPDDLINIPVTIKVAVNSQGYSNVVDVKVRDASADGGFSNLSNGAAASTDW